MSPATRGTQRFCPECGAKVTKTQKFCRECGSELQAGAEETVELSKPAPRGRAAASGKAPAPAEETRPLPPPPPPPGMPPPVPADRATSPTTEPALHWGAWVAAGACGVLAIATGIPWFGGGLGIDGLDVPLAVLFSDSADGGIPIGVLFIVAAAVGLGVAVFKPVSRPLSITFIVVGGVSTFFLLWYMIRALASVGGAQLFDVLSIGFWLAILASLATLAGGIILRLTDRRAAV